MVPACLNTCKYHMHLQDGSPAATILQVHDGILAFGPDPFSLCYTAI